MPFQARDITIPPVPDWLQRGAGAITQYIPDIFAPGDPYLPGTMLLPEYMKDWAQGETVDPSEMIFESLTNQMGGGQPLAQIAERSGAKNFGAMLHRTMDPSEFEFLDWLWKKGKQSEAASSVITPTYRSIFHPSESMPGVVFSVRNPENIRWWSPQDVWSRSYKDITSPSQKAYERLDSAIWNMAKDDIMNPKYDRYARARDKMIRMPAPREVIPDRAAYGSDTPLGKVLSDQQKRLEELALTDPNMQNHRFWELLNEVGYRMDPNEIVGVRVPRPTEPNLKEWEMLFGPNPQTFIDDEAERTVGPALDFAQRHNLPIWQFEPQTMPGEAAQGIMDYLGGGAGRWYKRRTEEFPMGLVESTADPLAKYYGRDMREVLAELRRKKSGSPYQYYTGSEGIEHLPPIELPAVNPFMYME